MILNITDATNLERNLYLTLQLLELKIPLVLALNVMDVVEKRGTGSISRSFLPGIKLSGSVHGGFERKGFGEAARAAVSLGKRQREGPFCDWARAR